MISQDAIHLDLVDGNQPPIMSPLKIDNEAEIALF